MILPCAKAIKISCQRKEVVIRLGKCMKWLTWLFGKRWGEEIYRCFVSGHILCSESSILGSNEFIIT